MPKTVDAEARRQEILAALWSVVKREGASAVSIRSIAAEGGWSKSSIAHYFPTQGDLLAGAMAQTVAVVTERLLRLDLLDCDVDTAVEALLAMIPDTPQRRRQASIWLLALHQSMQDPSVAKAVCDLNDTVRGGIDLVLQALDNQGLLNPDSQRPQTVDMLHAVIDGLSVRVLTEPKARARVRPAMHAAVTSVTLPTAAKTTPTPRH